jgi:hypothetical protein
MTKLDPEIVDYYDSEVAEMIATKYNYPLMQALRLFVLSKTHDMLEDEKHGFTRFGAGGVFDIWEAEHNTGDPRNSVYISGE